jgi:hypothetical protein
MRKKYGRSSRLVNPANCDELFKRTSSRRLIPAPFSVSKKSAADLLAKPIV